MTQTGITVAGEPVIGGLFELADTHGFPLTESLVQLRERGRVPDWHDYIGKAVKAGWKPEVIERRIVTAMEEAECPEDWQNGVKSMIPLSIRLHTKTKGPTP